MAARPLMLAMLAAALVWVPATDASTLVDRHATGVSLKVNARGVALLTYRTKGVARHVLAWGAVNASRTHHRLDYSGGWKSRVGDWRTFRNRCGPYTGPAIPFVTAACTAPDGSHWAVQEWVRLKANFGGVRGERELRLAHWSGEPASLEIYADWSRYRDGAGQHYHHLFGRYTYEGRPVFGQRSTPTGVPLDRYGRNVYIDSLDSDYGPGWRRVNAFLARSPRGQFCFEFGPKVGFGPSAEAHTGRSASNRYRASVIGPGVSPDVFVAFDGPGETYDDAWDGEMNALQRELVGHPSRGCGDPGGRDG
jgi:hypothetical protein